MKAPRTKIETLCKDLYREGKIDMHELAALIGAVTQVHEDDAVRCLFTKSYGTYSREGIASLMTESETATQGEM